MSDKKQIRFFELENEIQKYADKNPALRGNFTAAVREFVSVGLKEVNKNKK